jgi:hypothetical protein
MDLALKKLCRFFQNRFQKINDNFVTQILELINTSYIQHFLAKNLDFLDHKC